MMMRFLGGGIGHATPFQRTQPAAPTSVSEPSEVEDQTTKPIDGDDEDDEVNDADMRDSDSADGMEDEEYESLPPADNVEKDAEDMDLALSLDSLLQYNY